MAEEDARIKKSMENIGDSLKEQIMKEVPAVLETVLRTKEIPREKLGYTDAKIEALYGQAYRLYNTGKYKDAIVIFRLLAVVNPTEPKYSMGIAACFHMIKEYANAVQVYMLCGILDPENPIPHFHASDCYIQMGDKSSAIIALEMAVERARENPEYRIIKDRALLTIASLHKEIARQTAGMG